MSYSKHNFLRASDLMASDKTIPEGVRLFDEAKTLFKPLYALFGGNVNALDKTVCSAKTFAKGNHEGLRSLDKEGREKLIDQCEGFRKNLLDIMHKKPKDRDAKRCQDVVTRLRFLNDVMDSSDRPYP